MNLYFIRVKTLTNKLLIADGWQLGMFVIDGDTPYGPSFEPQACVISGYASRADADHLVSTIGKSYVGVTFEVIEYVPRSK